MAPDSAVQKIERRTRACLVVFDATERLLLLRHSDGHGREFWATPGGGVEAGETPEHAAQREAAEELGAPHVVLERLWSGHSRFRFADRDVAQDEVFFLIAQHAGVLESDCSALHRVEGIEEVRWWSLEELRTSAHQTFPTDLAARIETHLRAAREP